MPKLLVIDDDKDTLRILEAKLTDAGYQVLQASDGKTGLDKALELVPDMILLDVMMPEMDGKTVLQNLKFEPTTDSIPVVIMTAKGRALESEFQMEGATAYVTKPFIFSEVLETLTNIVPPE